MRLLTNRNCPHKKSVKKNIINVQVSLGFVCLHFAVDCSVANPCQNDGTCDTNACTCPSGFTGSVCDVTSKVF